MCISTDSSKTGAQADAFNAEFGIFTNFSAIPALDDQGKPVTGPDGPGSSSPDSGASDPPDFGKCSKPEILFASNLDGRKETAFAPVDKVSYNHGSADNIGVITQFMCDSLTNTCAANQAAKTLCDRAKGAANAAPPLTGEQADAFNAIFGEETNFASVTPIDNTGVPKPVITGSLKPGSTPLHVAGNGSLGTPSPAAEAPGNGSHPCRGPLSL